MYPHERSLVKKLADKPFVLLGVNTDSSKAELKQAMQQEQITWRSWFQGSTDGPISRLYKIEGYPTLFLLDHKGVIRKQYLGAPSSEQLDKEIDALVREAEAGS
jgi:hypothetical protein